MGRWAQRTRGGGSVTTPNQIISAVISGSGQDQVELTYLYNITAIILTGADFTSNASGEVGQSVAQNLPNSVLVQFLVDLTGDTSITYSGTVPGLLHPQTKNY